MMENYYQESAMQLMYGIVMPNQVHETQVPAVIAVSEKDVFSCFFEKL